MTDAANRRTETKGQQRSEGLKLTGRSSINSGNVGHLPIYDLEDKAKAVERENPRIMQGICYLLLIRKQDGHLWNCRARRAMFCKRSNGPINASIVYHQVTETPTYCPKNG